MSILEKGGDRRVKVVRCFARILSSLIIFYCLFMLIGYSISDPHSVNDEFPWFIFILMPLLIAMLLAWRWEWWGGIATLIGALLFGITVFITAGHNQLFAAIMISSPFFLVGILYISCWYRRKRILKPH